MGDEVLKVLLGLIASVVVLLLGLQFQQGGLRSRYVKMLTDELALLQAVEDQPIAQQAIKDMESFTTVPIIARVKVLLRRLEPFERGSGFPDKYGRTLLGVWLVELVAGAIILFLLDAGAIPAWLFFIGLYGFMLTIVPLASYMHYQETMRMLRDAAHWAKMWAKNDRDMADKPAPPPLRRRKRRPHPPGNGRAGARTSLRATSRPSP